MVAPALHPLQEPQHQDMGWWLELALKAGRLPHIIWVWVAEALQQLVFGLAELWMVATARLNHEPHQMELIPPKALVIFVEAPTHVREASHQNVASVEWVVDAHQSDRLHGSIGKARTS
eukprot:359915-Chlamydomonas_euryale.AAC.2